MNKRFVFVLVSVAFVLVNGVCYGMQAQVGPALRLTGDDDYLLSARAGVMFQSGEARELVFEGNHKLSELIWDISGLALAGGSVSLGYGNHLQLNAALWVGVNEGNGSMEDYDWFVEGMDWTHFSDGDVDINEAYIFDVNGSYVFHRAKSTEWFGILGFKQLFWDWSEYGRTYIYSVNGFRDSVGTSGGVNGIDYEQTFNVPYAGIGLRVSFGHVYGSLYGIYSPIAQAEDKDHHILREIRFTETFDGVDYIGFGGELTYLFSDQLFMTLAFDGHVIPETRGDMEYDDGSGIIYYNPDSAGIENTVVSGSIGIGLRM